MRHDPGEGGNTHDQNEGHDDALNFALRVVVAKADRRQRREHVVNDNDEVLTVCEICQPVDIVESEVLLTVRR